MFKSFFFSGKIMYTFFELHKHKKIFEKMREKIGPQNILSSISFTPSNFKRMLDYQVSKLYAKIHMPWQYLALHFFSSKLKKLSGIRSSNNE